MSKSSPGVSLQLQHDIEPRSARPHRNLFGLAVTLLLFASFALWQLSTSEHRHLLQSLGMTGFDSDTPFALALGLSCAVYLIASFVADTPRYLWHLDHVESILAYVERIKATAPSWEFACECYHMETKTRQVKKAETIYLTVDGKSVPITRTWTEPETYQEKMVTHTERQPFIYSRSQDVSPQLSDAIRRYQAVRVDCAYDISFGDQRTLASYEAAKAAFIAQNRHRDVFFHFSERHYIRGFKSKLLSVVDISKKPVLMHWGFYVLATVLLLSWPYSAWFHANTAGGHLEFRKLIFS